MLRLKLTDHIVVVRNVANSLVLLGLIGTVIGFIIALSGVDPEAASQVENVATMVSTLINGMSVALNTTLVGALALCVADRQLRHPDVGYGRPDHGDHRHGRSPCDGDLIIWTKTPGGRCSAT